MTNTEYTAMIEAARQEGRAEARDEVCRANRRAQLCIDERDEARSALLAADDRAIEARSEGTAQAIEYAEYMAGVLSGCGEVVRSAEWQDFVRELRDGDPGRSLTRLIAEKQGEARLAERQRIGSCERVRARYAHEGEGHAKVVLYLTDDNGRTISLILAPREFYVDDRARIAEKQAEALEELLRDGCEVCGVLMAECAMCRRARERAAAYRKGGAP
jgi:hypothetical protein